MLTVDIAWRLKSGRLPFPAHFTLCNSGGGRIADYRIVVHDATGGPLYECALLRYPRWSEPVAGLVARSIDRLQAALPIAVGGHDVAGAVVQTTILPGGTVAIARALAVLTLDILGKRGSATLRQESLPTITRSFELDVASATPLQLLASSLAQCVWQRADVPAMSFAAHDVPRFKHGKRMYIRSSDLPPWAATPFKRHGDAFTIHVPSEGRPCYDARAWDAFLGPQSTGTVTDDRP